MSTNSSKKMPKNAGSPSKTANTTTVVVSRCHATTGLQKKIFGKERSRGTIKEEPECDIGPPTSAIAGGGASSATAGGVEGACGGGLRNSIRLGRHKVRSIAHLRRDALQPTSPQSSYLEELWSPSASDGVSSTHPRAQGDRQAPQDQRSPSASAHPASSSAHHRHTKAIGQQPSFSESHRLRISREAVEEERKVKHQQFLRTMESNTRMTCLTRRDQHIALQMLLGEAWRHHGRHGKATQHQKQNKQSSGGRGEQRSPARDSRNQNQNQGNSSNSNNRVFDRTLMTHLASDVSLLMGSEAWGPEPEVSVEKHPYLFTINEIQKQRLFE